MGSPFSTAELPDGVALFAITLRGMLTPAPLFR
jgi:hypothetical protein